MKANELRCGNYYQDQNGNTEKLETFEINFCKIEYPDGLQPIPLTEEWLQKFGFENEKNIMNLRISEDLYLIFTKSNTDKIVFIESFEENHNGRIETTSIFPPCNYVHQLQNLYFSLTGEELTLKE